MRTSELKGGGDVTIPSQHIFSLTIVLFYEYTRGRFTLNGRVTFSGLAYPRVPISVSRATGSCTRMLPFRLMCFSLRVLVLL